MKTSVIEVHDMLSVLSVDEVEKRIGEVPGVESVTLNYAAASATVRYDETRLEVSDIKSVVRQRSYEPVEPVPSGDKPTEKKVEATATPPAVKPPEEKDKTETKPPTKAGAHDEHPQSTTIVKPVENKVDSPEEKDKAESKPPAKAEDLDMHPPSTTAAKL